MMYKCKKSSNTEGSLFILNAKDRNEAINLARRLFGNDKFYLGRYPCDYIIHVWIPRDRMETYHTATGEFELIERNENVTAGEAISNE